MVRKGEVGSYLPGNNGPEMVGGSRRPSTLPILRSGLCVCLELLGVDESECFR